jgi:tellurite resistance protein
MGSMKTALDKVKGKVDQAIAVVRAQQEQAAADAQEARLNWLGPMVEAAYVVAAADGKLTDAERGEMIEGFGAFGASAADVENLIDTVAGSSDDRDTRIARVAEGVSEEGLREGVFLVASAVAWKDGGIGEKQGLAVRALGKAFGFGESKLQKLLAQAH